MKHKLIFILLFIVSLSIKASYRSEVYFAYINNRMDLWKNVIVKMEAIPDKSNEFLLELINYQYGYIGYCIGFDMKDEARVTLGLAHRYVGILEKRKYNLSIINSYKAAFYGFSIGLNPISAPVNGFKSIDCAKTALKLDSLHYFGYVQYANMKSNMPTALGGSKKQALKYYLKAREIIEKDVESISGNWNYISLLVVIAQTYTYLEDYSSAQKIYDEILNIEPGFLYVTDDLYPKLLKKMDI